MKALEVMANSIGNDMDVLEMWRDGEEWDCFQRLYGSDDILPSEAFEKWFAVQWNCVMQLMIGRWELTGELLHEAERYEIREDWKEEVGAHFLRVYPPTSLETYLSTFKNGEQSGG